MRNFGPAQIEGASLSHRLAVSAVVAWKDFGKFSSRDGAIAAVQGEASTGLSDDECGDLIDLTAAAYEAALHSVPLNVRRRRFRVSPFASAKDIDQEACLQAMRDVAPDLPHLVHDYLLGWVIYWHWVR